MNQENTAFMAWVEELKAQHPAHGEYIDCATEEARAKILSTLRTVKEVNDNYYMSMVRFVYRATGTKKEQERIDIAVKSIQKFNSTGGTNEDPNEDGSITVMKDSFGMVILGLVTGTMVSSETNGSQWKTIPKG